MSCISSRSIQACAHLRNVCSRSHVLPARPFARFSLARVCSPRDRAPYRRASVCASCRASTVRNSQKHLSASHLSQRFVCKRNMSSDATATTTPEKATTADNNPLLEVSCERASFFGSSRLYCLNICAMGADDRDQLMHVHVWVCRTQSRHNSTRSRQSMLCLVSRLCLQRSILTWMN